ncbi:G protein-coupled receptor-like protein [Leptotrombidium deliense]|uniref:G protein-coupled receptor-like protein n=1 Tax=Leptotrombidium deliense TaxID=299467 RepID=A0A443SS11_9ACAR|nr:G protein-coupled receptor-like protein [Leptotrombidium deliense]
MNDTFNSTSVQIACLNSSNEVLSTAVWLISDETTVPSNSTSEPDYSMQWWQTLIWTFFFGLMVIIATGGNLIVIWIVLSSKRMRTVTNYFIVNLSVADTMVSTLNVIFSGFQMLSGEWPFGLIYCKISNFVAILSVAAMLDMGPH